MKNSNIQWIGEIPDNWEVVKGKYIFAQRNERGNNNELQLLTPSQKYGVIPQSEYEKISGMTAVKLNEKTDLKLLKTIHKGDFCISLRSFQGGFEYSKYEGVCSPAYQIFYATTTINDTYYHYLFKTSVFIDKINSFTLSLRDGKNIAYSDFGNTYIPLPPLSTQTAIAAYLDAKCSEIDGLIADINKQIETLNELKKSTITEAVTKGLNKNAKLKDSGIQWIGMIPEGWRMSRVKYLLIERKNYSIYGEEEPLSMSQKYGLIPTSEMENVPHQAATLVGSKIANVGDLVFNKLKAHLGVFSVSKYYGLVSPDYAVYYSNGKSDVKYLEFLFKTQLYISQFKKLITGVGAGLSRLYTSDLYSIHSIYPPLAEQQSIATYLDTKCSEFDSIISDKQKQISTLEAYKKSLIYEYVTGKNAPPVIDN